jgi:pilus assembly protein Flp/PilA
MTTLRQLLQNFRREERGQGMVEYSLILALVSVAAIGTLTTMGTNVKSVFTNSSNALTSTAP